VGVQFKKQLVKWKTWIDPENIKMFKNPTVKFLTVNISLPTWNNCQVVDIPAYGGPNQKVISEMKNPNRPRKYLNI
jgi:hypothetical protein